MYYDDTQNACYNSTSSVKALTPITGIPCNYECGEGEHLNVDTKNRLYSCAKCPKNTYSTGGGFYIDGYLG